MPTKEKIIEQLAKDRVIEEILDNIVKGHKEDWHEDIVQDLYLNLLEKPEELLQHLYKTNALKFFLTRMILNNVQSFNGPSRNYIKWEMLKSENGIPEIIDEDYED